MATGSNYFKMSKKLLSFLAHKAEHRQKNTTQPSYSADCEKTHLNSAKGFYVDKHAEILDYEPHPLRMRTSKIKGTSVSVSARVIRVLRMRNKDTASGDGHR